MIFKEYRLYPELLDKSNIEEAYEAVDSRLKERGHNKKQKIYHFVEQAINACITMWSETKMIDDENQAASSSSKPKK